MRRHIKHLGLCPLAFLGEEEDGDGQQLAAVCPQKKEGGDRLATTPYCWLPTLRLLANTHPPFIIVLFFHRDFIDA